MLVGPAAGLGGCGALEFLDMGSVSWVLRVLAGSAPSPAPWCVEAAMWAPVPGGSRHTSQMLPLAAHSSLEAVMESHGPMQGSGPNYEKLTQKQQMEGGVKRTHITQTTAEFNIYFK